MHPLRQLFVVSILVAAVLLVGCVTRGSPDRIATAYTGHAETGIPRIELERVVDDDTVARSGRRLVRWLTGMSEETQVFVRPYGVAWDGADLVVADPGGARVVRIRNDGRVQVSPAGAFEQPIGVARCARGIVVTDARAGTVSLLNSDLKPVAVLVGGIERPTGVACAGGLVLVVETGQHRVLVLEAGGREAEAGLPLTAEVLAGERGDGRGQFNFPTTVATDGETIWVGDTLNFRVQRIRLSDGTPLGSFGALGDGPGDMPRIKGIALDSLGNLWVTDAHLDRVKIYGTDGGFLGDIGGAGDVPGQFSFPAGVAADGDGRIAVVDSLNRRIQTFRVRLESARSER